MVYVWLLIGFLCLIYGGNMLVQGAVQLARRLGVSPLLIGLTLVGFGTSTPELITSILAVFKGSASIAVGNVVGSNIANILLVLGVAAVISPVSVDLKAFKRDGLFLALSTLGVVVSAFLGKINCVMGVILVGMLIYYVVYSYISDRKNQKALKEKEKELSSECGSKEEKALISFTRTVVGIGVTLLGASLLVDNAIVLARNWGISEAVIGLTVVAVGTSLPELITSIMSGIHKQGDVAFGNVVGSNIYNALFILGMTALLTPVDIPENMGEDFVIMTLVTISLIGIAYWKKCFSRMIGVIYLVTYALYTWWLF